MVCTVLRYQLEMVWKSCRCFDQDALVLFLVEASAAGFPHRFKLAFKNCADNMLWLAEKPQIHELVWFCHNFFFMAMHVTVHTVPVIKTSELYTLSRARLYKSAL